MPAAALALEPDFGGLSYDEFPEPEEQPSPPDNLARVLEALSGRQHTGIFIDNLAREEPPIRPERQKGWYRQHDKNSLRQTK